MSAAAAALLLGSVPIGARGQVGGVGDERTDASPTPGAALVASAAYPGLGQLLNGNESKALILGVTEGLLIARLVLEDRWTRNAFRLYQETGEVRYYDDYSEHFDRRQTLIWWVVVAGLYGVVDAYVDAHLSGFEEPVSPYFACGGPGRESASGWRLGVAVRF